MRMAAPSEHGYPEQIDDVRTAGISLRDVSFALRNHKWLIVGFAVVGSTLGTAALLAVSPTYTAESSIVIDARRPRVSDLPSLVSEQNTAPEVAQLRSEVEILQSDNLAERVIGRLGLLQKPEFQQHPTLVSAAITDFETWLGRALPPLPVRLFASLTAAPANAVDSNQAALASALKSYGQNLSVTNDGRSYVIRVQYRSHDPALAAKIVNTHVQIYLTDQIGFKQEIGKQASAWLTRELSSLQAKLRASEEAVQRFREDNQIIQSGGTTLLSQQLAAINAQIPAAAADVANREATLRHAQQLLARNSIDAQADVLDSPLIQRLREQEAALLQRQADLQATFGDQHPTVIRVNAEVRDLRQTIHLAVARIIKGLENDLQVARAKEQELQSRLVELERRTVVADRAESKLRDLQREVSANSSLIEVLLNRYKQVSAQEEIQQADARVVSEASPPGWPSFPRPSTQVPIIFAFSTFCGTAVALLKELLRRGFKGSREIEVECELPSLGSVPMVPRAWPRVANPHDLVVDQPSSGFAEAIRYIQNSIQATSRALHTAPKTFLITSSLPHEGKSVLAASLARSCARSGKRTLLIDCDVRNPSVHRMIPSTVGTAGIGKVLSCDTHWQDAVYTDQKSTLDIIGADIGLSAPHDLVCSAAMRELITQCRRHYDVIILDSPPITAVSDALTLSRWVDATILAVRWGETPREIAKTSLNKLFLNGARLCGAVLTQIDMRRGVFSPAELEYYHKHNRLYYAR